MPRGGRPRQHADLDARNTARRARRQERAVGARPAFTLPGQMVWEVVTSPTAAPILPRLDPAAPLLHEVLPRVELNQGEDWIDHGYSDAEDDGDSDATTAETQASASMEISETPSRSASPHSSRSPSADPDEEAPLPATALVHFLATQLLSADPAQTLHELARTSPGAQAPLLETLRQREDEAAAGPVESDGLSLRAGLEHIQAHYPLDKQLPNVISEPSIRCPDVVYTAEELQYLFTGYTCAADRDRRPHIDALVEEVDDYTVGGEFDVDSIVLLSEHLGVFRQGILWYPSQMPTGALTTSMHLQSVLVQYSDRHGHLHQPRVPLHHVPNYCFARLPGVDAVTAHWIFPRLYQPSEVSVAEKEGQRLTEQQFRHWTDRVLLPSLRECLPAGRLQHLPTSFRQAQANARAKRTETRTAATDNGAAHHQSLQYELPAVYLPALQEAMWRRIEEPGNHQFRDAQIVVVGLGLKLRPWKSVDWATTLDSFFSWFGRQFDLRHIHEDRVHVDIGKETLPPASYSLLWREDFLRLFAACLQSLDPTSTTLEPTLYPWGFVRGVGSATLELPLSSRLRNAGVSYIQHYPSFKEKFAAGNTYPFSNDAFSSLALSPEVMATFQHVGGAISVRPEVLLRAYIHCKLRCHYGLMAPATGAWGSRWECRVTLRLLRQINQYVRRLSASVAPFAPSPMCAWVIYTTDILEEWYRFHLNKFCFGFETLYGRCRAQPYIAWEHTQLMILLLKCIACFAGVLIPGSYPALWRDHYRPRARRGAQATVEPPQTRQGLAIGANMRAYGYGWLADKIDWQNWVLRPEVSGEFRVQNVSILASFRARYRELRNSMDDYVLVASSVPHLSRWKESRLHVAFILRLFRAICIRALLRDVFQILRPYVRPGRWTELSQGRLGLSADTLHRVLDPNRAISSIMASPHQKIRNYHGLFQWLWGEDDGFSRGAWARLPYRTLYTFCRQLIIDVLGHDHDSVWRQQFSKHIRINCWVLPYPNQNLLISHGPARDERRHFRWWSNFNFKVAQAHGAEADRIIRCRQWISWPAGRWSVTPETGKGPFLLYETITNLVTQILSGVSLDRTSN